jgi:hypothetical protein
MPAPTRRVLAVAEAPGLRPIQHPFDPTTHPAAVSGFVAHSGSTTFITIATSTSPTGTAPKVGEA